MTEALGNLSHEQARALLTHLSWSDVRMLSFDLNSLEVLLQDGRRIRITLDRADQAYTILSALNPDQKPEPLEIESTPLPGTFNTAGH